MQTRGATKCKVDMLPQGIPDEDRLGVGTRHCVRAGTNLRGHGGTGTLEGGDSRLAGGVDTKTRFLQRRGTSMRISIAVYLCIRGPSASMRSLVPVLVFHGFEVSMMMHVGGNSGMGGGGIAQYHTNDQVSVRMPTGSCTS